MVTKRKLILNSTRKWQFKFLGDIMRKEGLENMILTGQENNA